MNNSIQILAGWLIDGSGSPVKKNMMLHIEGGYIRSIKKADPAFSVSDSQNPIADLSDCTILPGLVDSHLHVFMSGTSDLNVRKHQLEAGFDEIKDVISKHLNQLLCYGVVAARDGGDNKAHALRYKTECWQQEVPDVCLKSAGKAWHKPGRYGRLIGRTPPDNQTLAEAIAEEKENIDHIKIVNSGLNSLTQFGKQTAPQFNLEEMKSAVHAANMRGLKIMVHANGNIPVQIAVESGCHSIEHGFFMGKDNLKRMRDKQVIWVPTAYTMKAYSEHLKDSRKASEISKKNLDHQLEQIFQARETGVTIALGTDAGSLGVHHGSAVIEELGLLMTAGYSIEQAIQCAAFNGARLAGLKDIGLLAQDMAATFIAVKGDPSHLPEHLDSVERLYIKGVSVRK